jgi:hypothetical protein
VAPFRTADMRRAVRAAARQADDVVVLVHAGLEFHQHPEPSLRQFARDALATGAAAVIGGHPHCVRAIVCEKRGPVAYSLGDFIADTADERHLAPHLERTALSRLGAGVPNPCICRQGLVAELDLRGSVASLRARPIEVAADFLPRPADAQTRAMMRRRLQCLGLAACDRRSRAGAARLERAYRRRFGETLGRRLVRAVRFDVGR